ncbi:MAG: cation diffusion facilitator family transporter [Candidatus Limnocylindria bacterium]
MGSGEGHGGTFRAVLAAFLGNLAIAITKAVATVLTGSGGLAAETAHSFADSINQVLLLVGVARSGRPPTEQHPLGFGKERYFWSLVVALLLFFGGGVIALYEAYDRLESGGALGDPTVGFVVLIIAAVFEVLSLGAAIREMRTEARAAGLGLWRFFAELRDPAMRTVVFEQFADLVGLALALAGLALTAATGDARFDAAASGAIGLVLIVVAFELARDARALIIGEGAPADVRDALRRSLAEDPRVDDIIELYAVRIGAGQLLVMARLSVRDDIDAGEVERLLVALRERLQREHPDVMKTFLEVNPSRSTAPRHRGIAGAAGPTRQGGMS